MAVKLEKLVNSFSKKELRLLAGKKGMNRIVRWVHMVEGIDISVFLDEQELAFTTGVALRDKSELIELVKLLVEGNASGVVINTGPYIEEIPEKVIEYCEENDFPIFEMPWEVYLAKIMKKLCYQITLSDRLEMELSGAIKNAIFFPEQQSTYLPQLDRYGFKSEWSYCFASVEITKQNEAITDKNRNEQISKKIETFITHALTSTFVLEVEGKYLLLFAEYKEEEILDILNGLSENLAENLFKEEKLFIAMGENTENLVNLWEAHKKVQNTGLIQKKMGLNEDIFKYKDLGIYKLLLAIENKKLIEEFCRETIGGVEDYDRLNNGDYMEVLESYLRNSGSVKAVAEELFFHKNTIGYKLSRIEQIIGYNLSHHDVRMRCSGAIMLREIY